jgi:hypothetical protein
MKSAGKLDAKAQEDLSKSMSQIVQEEQGKA